MLVTPGPAFVVIPIGLALLSLEFAWAEGLLERALEKGEQAKRKAQETTHDAARADARSPRARVRRGRRVGACFGDIPLLPF